MRNKANFCSDSHGRGLATLPVSPVGPIVLNKANLPCTGRQGRGLVGPESLPPLGTIAPNKANSPRAMGRASTSWKKSYDELDTQRASEKQSQFPHGQSWPRAGKAAGSTRCAKQSQFAPDRPEETLAAGARWDRLYKQSQLADTDGGGRGPEKSPAEPSLGLIAPNKPNLPWIGRKRCRLAGPQLLPPLGQSHQTRRPR